MESLLSIKNIDISYGKIRAIRRVSMHVNQGEVVSLIGGNGAGKTTLLSGISGLLRSTGGEIHYDGGDVTRAKPEKLVKLGVSHVPEGRLVFKPMSVEDNLLLGSFVRYKVKTRSEVHADMDKVYAMFPVLKERRRQHAGTLSGGEQQMLAIGRALMARPRLLLLDEPSMGLAPMVVKEIFEHIVMMNKELDVTVLLVEQNARSALQIADRGYVIETGRIILQGPAAELMENKEVQRAYLGRDLDSETTLN